MMMQIVPTRWYSWDFSVMEESRPVADIDVGWWREKAVLTIQGRRYGVYREGLVSGAFILESGGTMLARAEKPSAFRRTFLIHHAGREYTLRAKSAFGRRFVLLNRSRQVGSLAPTSVFRRGAAVDLPDEWPLPVRAFTIWLTVALSMRDEAAVVVGGALGGA